MTKPLPPNWTPWTALARSLPRLPSDVPGGLTPVEVIDCGPDGLVAACQWGEDSFMLVRVSPEEGQWPDRPLTPLLTRGDIDAVAIGVLTGDQRVRTWSLSLNVLALGALLAGGPREPEGEVDRLLAALKASPDTAPALAGAAA